MSQLDIQFRAGAVWLPGLELWLDAHRARKGPERVFVSHAHMDHTGRHREVMLTEATSRFMRSRLGGQRVEHILPWGEPRDFTGPTHPFRLTLLPAGHILGSAMAMIESGSERLLYTGDFKLRPGLAAEVCDPAPAVGCDVLIMETTFGRARYRMPPPEEVIQKMIHFCRETLARDETPVLLGYSLGKSQEILHSLAGAALPVVLHAQVLKLTRVYEALGHVFPAYEAHEPGVSCRRKVFLCPPGALTPALRGALHQPRVAVITGWAVDSGCQYRYGADAAFALSDHADFPDLIEFVRRVRPRRILTLHGFAADFAATLRELGFDASALGVDEQLTLPLGLTQPLAGSGTTSP